MDKELLFVVGVFWLTCTAYVLYYFNKHHKVNFETICFAILLGPIIALIMKDPAEEELKPQQELKDFWEDVRRRFESEDNTIPDFRHTTTPPPPPISRIERAQTERDDAIRMAIERIEPPNRKPNNKDFKFFRG